MTDVDTAAEEVAEDFLDALADQDFARVRELLADDVWTRALLTRETVERHDADGAVELLHGWHGDTAGFVVLDRECATVATRERVRFRFAERPSWAREQWHVIEQTGFLRVRDGRISRLDLACTGYHPVVQPPARFATRRLVMRPWDLEDADHLLAIRRRPEITRWLSDPQPWTRRDQLTEDLYIGVLERGPDMDEREQQRKVRHRLAVLRHAAEVTGNVSATCRYYGISRPTFYKWLSRYEEHGQDGLRDRSSRPHHSPRQTDTQIVGKIIYLRSNYHFGPHKIAMYLKRYHDIEVSPSGVWRILKRLDMNRLPASQRHQRHDRRWKRYEKPLPGHRVQVDVKFIEPVAVGGPDRLSSGRRKRYYQFTAIDDCTRIRVLKIFDRNTQASAIQFIDYVFEKLPFRVEVVQTDNGAEFGSRFHYHVLDAGVGHVHIKPSTPRLNGKVERSHRIDAEEFYRMLDGVVIDDTAMFNDKLREWEDFYNFSRPHGSLGGQTPYERLRQKTQAPT